MKEVLFITPKDSAPGFALTGVRQQALDAGEFWPALREACNDPKLGVIAIDARLLEGIDHSQVLELTRGWHGVLVTLPAPATAQRAHEDDLQALVRRALGYHVRLES